MLAGGTSATFPTLLYCFFGMGNSWSLKFVEDLVCLFDLSLQHSNFEHLENDKAWEAILPPTWQIKRPASVTLIIGRSRPQVFRQLTILHVSHLVNTTGTSVNFPKQPTSSHPLNEPHFMPAHSSSDAIGSDYALRGLLPNVHTSTASTAQLALTPAILTPPSVTLEGGPNWSERGFQISRSGALILNMHFWGEWVGLAVAGRWQKKEKDSASESVEV
eukprot:6127117-Amphidinium_carterae.2